MSNDMPSGVVESMITLTAADGFMLGALHARPQGEAKGGIVILQEIFGLTEQMKETARSYAVSGYEVIFPCFFDRVEKNLVIPFNDPDRGRTLSYGLALDKVRMDVAAAVALLRERTPGVFLLGYCWGGGVAVGLSQYLDIAGAISFYGTRLDTYAGIEPRCPLLFHFGETDPNSKPELIEKMHASFPMAEMHVYPAGHAFANDHRPSYVAEAAQLARERSFAFMQRHVKKGQ